jgi:hypothetical protein
MYKEFVENNELPKISAAQDNYPLRQFQPDFPERVTQGQQYT